jgi:hypothetical protein
VDIEIAGRLVPLEVLIHRKRDEIRRTPRGQRPIHRRFDRVSDCGGIVRMKEATQVTADVAYQGGSDIEAVLGC